MSLTNRLKNRPATQDSQAQAIANRILDDRQDRSSVILSVDQIEVDEQARKNLGDLKPLAKSIKDHGQMNAIIVLPTDNPHRFKLSKGERRYFAIRDELHEFTIRATIDNSGVHNDRVKHRISQMHENIQRKDYEPFELAEEFDTIIKETGWTHEQLADEVGVTKSWVSRKLSLLKAPPEIQAAIREGRMAETDYYNNKQQKLDEAASKKGRSKSDESEAAKTPKKFALPWDESVEIAGIVATLMERSGFKDVALPPEPDKKEMEAFYTHVREVWGRQ